MAKSLNLTLKVWRQKNREDAGHFETYEAKDISTEMSFLEMLDVVNNGLLQEGRDPIAFDHDCREGICGACGVVVNGLPHGQDKGTTACQLHMRRFKDGETITLEPWRAKAFPVIKDLVVDRSAFDNIMHSGGFISIKAGNAQDANSLPVPKQDADTAMDAAACIGCGACVAACKNASAMLFVSAKVSHLAHLPQGKPEAERRVTRMVKTMDEAGFGNCSNTYQCEAACPKEISVSHIAKLNREYGKAILAARK